MYGQDILFGSTHKTHSRKGDDMTHTKETRTKNTNISNQKDNVILPLPPLNGDRSDMAVYARFMRHLRHVPNSRMEIKVLSAMQFTADMMGYSDAHIAKILMDCGLRAARIAFPADFLDHADAALQRSGWEVGGPDASLNSLKAYWDDIGEDKFVGFKRDFATLDEGAYL